MVSTEDCPGSNVPRARPADGHLHGSPLRSIFTAVLPDALLNPGLLESLKGAQHGYVPGGARTQTSRLPGSFPDDTSTLDPKCLTAALPARKASAVAMGSRPPSAGVR